MAKKSFFETMAKTSKTALERAAIPHLVKSRKSLIDLQIDNLEANIDDYKIQKANAMTEFTKVDRADRDGAKRVLGEIVDLEKKILDDQENLGIFKSIRSTLFEEDSDLVLKAFGYDTEAE